MSPYGRCRGHAVIARASSEPLLHIVLVGHPAFTSQLDAMESHQFVPRPMVHDPVSPLTPKESQAYIEPCLAHVTAQTEQAHRAFHYCRTPAAVRAAMCSGL